MTGNDTPFLFSYISGLDSVSQLKQYLDINVVFWNGFFDIYFLTVLFMVFEKHYFYRK